MSLTLLDKLSREQKQKREAINKAADYQEVLQWIALQMTLRFDKQAIIEEIKKVLK